MSDLKHSIVLDLAGNLERRARQYERALGQLERNGGRSMRGLSRSGSTVLRGFDRLGNRYSAMLGGAAGVGTARILVNDQRRFTRLGIQANKSQADIAALKEEIFETARAAEIRVDPYQITSAIEQIVEKTGDLKFAQDNLKNIGLVIGGTGADGTAVGGILAEFQKMGISAPDQVLKAIDILNAQGKEGAFTLANLASLGSRVVTAYTAMGRTGVPAIREMGAALQVIRQGTGTSEMAATAFEALLRTLGDAKKVGMLQKGGIQVFDSDALKEGREVLRPINELIVDIIQKTGGKKTILSRVFDAEAIRAFNAASAEFQQQGSVHSLQKFIQVQADGTTTMRDSARAANDAAGGISAVNTALRKFADEQLSGTLLEATDALNSLEAATVDRWIKVGGVLLAIGAAGVGIAKIVKGIKYLAAVPGIASAVPLAPAAGAASLGAGSRTLGKLITDHQVAAKTDQDLQTIRARQMVMGGGADSYQVQAIDRELNRRFSGELKISIDSDGRPTVRQLTSGPDLDIDVDTGQMMRSH